MTSMTSCLLLLVTMFACSSAFNWQQVESMGSMGYYSVGCTVDTNQGPPMVGGSFDQEPVRCMNYCIDQGGDVFDVSDSGCFCYTRDMAKAPMPFIDNVGTPTDNQSCGYIEM
jgi:hypothetical protein